MLTVSLHGILIQAPIGLYAQEHILGNSFEVDVDIWLSVTSDTWPYADYTIIHDVVHTHMAQQGLLLEEFVRHIHHTLKEKITDAEKVRVAIKKLHPPMKGEVKYAQVCYEG